MFDIGFTELLLVAVILLVVVGPEKLPGTLRVLFRYIRQFKKGFKQIRDEVERELALEDLKEEVHSIKDSFDADLDDALMYQEIKESVTDIAQETRKISDVIKGDDSDLKFSRTHSVHHRSVEVQKSDMRSSKAPVEPPIVTLEDLKAFEALEEGKKQNSPPVEDENLDQGIDPRKGDLLEEESSQPSRSS